MDLTFALWLTVITLLYHSRLLNGDGDLARHIVTGNHILTHGPRFADPFSFTRAGEPFIAYEWLSQSIFALVHQGAGLAGLVLLAAVLLAAAFALVVAYVRGHGGDPWLAVLCGTAAALLSGPHWMVRPHLFTLLGLALLLHVLRSGRVWLVALLFVLWANLHPGFLYGIGMVGLWSLGRALDDVRAGARGAALARHGVPVLAAGAASLVNPFGWGVHIHSLGLLGSSLPGVIDEFLPLDPLSWYAFYLAVPCGLAVWGMYVNRRELSFSVPLVLAAAAVAALMAQRHATLIGVFALPLAAHALTPLVRELPRWIMGRMRAEFERSDRREWRVGATALGIAAFVLTAGSVPERSPLRSLDFSADVFPKAAVRAGLEHAVHGRLLSEYSWGGYVLYAWPGQRVFVDSMADFFGEELVHEYGALRDARGDWQQLLDTHGISVVLFPPATPLVRELLQSAEWRVVHEDSVAVLLMRAWAPPATGTAGANT